MDYIKLVSAIQKDKGMTDAEVAEYSGISEYGYYALKKYRMYLTKVAYFSLNAVFGLENRFSELDEILMENKQKVGTPETNLQIAAEYVNPEKLGKLEKELAKCKKTLDSVKVKDALIEKQSMQIDKINRDLENSWKESKEKVKDAYSEGIRKGLSQIRMMKEANNQHMVDLLNEEYKDKIGKLEVSLDEVNKKYAGLYKVVEHYNKTAFDGGVDLEKFDKPLELRKEEIGMIISEDVKLQVLSCYKDMGMSVEEIMEEVSLSREKVEEILGK